MTQLFLLAPDNIAPDLLLACARAAVQVGNCASIVIPANSSEATVAALQVLGLATLLRDAEPRHVISVMADGLHLSNAGELIEARKALKNESLGFFASASRHAAMEAAEAGADYVAFAQTKQVAGEPIIGWWQDVTQIPSVALDPVAPEALSELLLQKPDFIRPSDDMWQSAEMATRVISAMMARLTP